MFLGRFRLRLLLSWVSAFCLLLLLEFGTRHCVVLGTGHGVWGSLMEKETGVHRLVEEHW